MARSSRWTAGEVRRLLEGAGREPVGEIARAVGRSPEAVVQKAKRMRRAGEAASLRRHVPRCSETCASCGSPRTAVDADGLCRPCRVRRLIEKCDADTARAISMLPPEQRAVYARTEATLSSRADPPPRADPRERSRDPREAARARDERLAAEEERETRNLERVLKARRRRYERICGKIVKK